VEVEAGIFRQVDGDRVLALKQDSDGRRWLFAGPLAYFQVPWYETPALLLPLMGVSLLVFFSTWIAGLVFTLRRKSHSLPEQAAWWLAGGLGLFDLGLFAWLVSALLGFADRFVYPHNTVTTISILYWLAIPWTLAVLALAACAWVHRQWTPGRRVHYTLAALTGAVFVWLLWSVNLIGGRFQ
jgi:hypothetical protein